MNHKLSPSSESLLRPYYISKQWLHKLKHFGEAGSIDNSDFICKHNFVYPNLWKIVDSVSIPCSSETWQSLVESFGHKYRNSVFTNESNYLYPCKQCQLDDESIKQRQNYEKSEFIKLREKWNQEQYQNGRIMSNIYAISAVWFKEWERFVQLSSCPLKHQIPGKINNMTICIQSNKFKHQLNPSKNFTKITSE